MRDIYFKGFIVIIQALIVGIIIFVSVPIVRHFAEQKSKPYLIRDSVSFQDSVLNFIFDLRLEHPYIVFAQAKEESGNWTSVVWLENNNMFGMKMPERRVTLAIGIKRGYAVYKDWRDCLIDYAFFQSAYMRNLSEDEYFKRLASSYAENEAYERNLKLHKKLIKQNGSN